MIEVVIYYQDSSIKGFTVSGHAGYAARGEDIVCAAVSALAQTALLGLNSYLSGKFQWKIDDQGYLECYLAQDLTAEDWEKSQVILKTLELGLLKIQESYEQFLTVCKRRWNL